MRVLQLMWIVAALAMAGCAKFEVRLETEAVLTVTAPVSPGSPTTPAAARTAAQVGEAASETVTPTMATPTSSATEAAPSPTPSLEVPASATPPTAVPASPTAPPSQTAPSVDTTATPTITASPTACQGWFFAPAPAACPAASAVVYDGAAQWFERGFMLWTRDPDKFYVFLNEAANYVIVAAPYSIGGAQPITATPPDGRQAPASGFGLVWRGEIHTGNVNFEDLPERMGWALGPEQEYATEFQCQVALFRSDERCYLRDPNGAIVSITSGGAWAYWP